MARLNDIVRIAVASVACFVVLGLLGMSCKPPAAKQSAAQQPQAARLDAAGGADGGDSFDSLDDDDDGEDEGLEALLEECGVDQKSLDNPSKLLVKKDIKSWPKVLVGQKSIPIVGTVNYKVSIVTNLKIRSSLKSTTTETSFQVEGTPSEAEKEARKKTDPKQGKTTAIMLSVDDRTKLMGESDDWEGVLCTIMPAKKVKTALTGHSVEIEYEPALPSSISPKADLSRYDEEIGSGKTFSEIKAKVLSSSNPQLRKGKVYEGEVKIERVDSTLILQAGEAQQTIRADAAYKVSYDFGTRTRTEAMGFFKSQTFYIDSNKKDFAAIVVDTGDEETGTVVFSELFD